jgi:hypothetical protein
MNLRRLIFCAGLAAVAAASASCGDVVRQGRSPSMLVIESLGGIRGAATPGPVGNPLASDVITNVTTPEPCSPTNPCPTVFSDSGEVTMRLILKDIGTPENPNAPTSNNAVTINRYRVTYRRADGRGTEGVDVPYPFDGFVTATVPPSGAVKFGFELVRIVAKKESPLAELKFNSTFLTLLTDVTFYGRDQVGNDVSVTGSVQIDAGNFGDF